MRFVRSSSQLPRGGVQQRELFAFALYRLLEAVLLAVLAFMPDQWQLLSQVDAPLLRAAATAYLTASLLLLWLARRPGADLALQGGWGLATDIATAAVVLAAQQGLDAAVGLLLLFNICIGSLLLGPRLALALALLAAGAVFGEFALSTLAARDDRPLVEPAMFALCYLAGALLSQFLRRELARSEALADARGSEVERLAQLNELVIRRMRTGVLVVDEAHRIRLFNEAAWALLGARGDAATLAEVNPRLDTLLRQWRSNGQAQPRSLRAGEEGPELLPRFAATGTREELFLIFLDDARHYSGRAEELTLATLGRLGASIAHEIRNPLTAILHAAQLLEESPALAATDRRLIEIILGQCQRMDGIVDSILGLARRQPAQAECVDLPALLRRFVAEYAAAHPLGEDVLEERSPRPLQATVDPRHLQQVLTVLVDNARHYGRRPGEPARVLLRALPAEEAGQPEGAVEIDVLDHGPGIPAGVASRLFTPFFTTSEHGTGLGLYIARQLCEANQGSLRYVPVPTGGACFRIRLPGRGGIGA
ncbi:sensor histidine kinase [Silanimonas lenta]|uniref:sensor histidine kinase n=1 Tax=Silanimonas lenta TaxID=265429 RepID=UPI00056D203C|nr:HAMP domain-containing sensor histidine kinase [Silanimonas lenta]